MGETSQELKISFNVVATDHEDFECELEEFLSLRGFRFILSGGGPTSERNMLFERDLCAGVDK